MVLKESLKEKAYHAILEGIYSSEYKPNQILNEKELCARYGYSKSPIREALTALCHDGVLKSIPRCGYVVVQLTRADIKAILAYRLVLESGFLKFYGTKLTEEQFQKLEELNALCNKPDTDILDHWRYNADFHTALLSFSGNEFAVAELRRAMQVLRRAYAQFYWNKWDNLTLPGDMRMHREIIDALRKKDIERAQDLLISDLQDFGMSPAGAN